MADPRSLAQRSKEVLDRILAAALLVVLVPVWLTAALVIRLTSRGPILYRRRVLGLHGVEFDALKLRTMVVDADDLLRRDPALLAAYRDNVKLRTDPRLTPAGRFLRRTSIDELPQLLNVLRGEMSLVGPRMIAPEEAPRYGAALAKRLSVRPGITGLWQVSGRQEVGYDERVKLDLHYIDNWSLWLDLVILVKTIPAVLSTKGAY